MDGWMDGRPGGMAIERGGTEHSDIQGLNRFAYNCLTSWILQAPLAGTARRRHSPHSGKVRRQVISPQKCAPTGAFRARALQADCTVQTDRTLWPQQERMAQLHESISVDRDMTQNWPQ